jgi:hypothetical protein
MEPRPQRPSRATGPYISTGTPNPPSAPTVKSGSGYGTAPFDASSAPPVPPPAIGYDPDYSPGQPLTPLRGPRGANIVGPLLAVAALAIIVAAVAFIVSQFRGGNDNNPQPTAVVAINASPTAGTDQQANTGAVDNSGGTGNTDPAAQPTSETANAEPTRTPRVNRPTETGGDLSGSSDGNGSDSNSTAPSDRTRARQWLPTTKTVGSGYEQSDNGTRDAAQVANSFPNPDEATTKLTEFGWVENAYREFTLPNGSPSDTTVVTVSVHRFDTERGAKDALPYFVSGSNLAEVDKAPSFGEESTTVQGQLEAGSAYVIYIRQNDFILRISGFSAEGDPAETTQGIAERILK